MIAWKDELAIAIGQIKGRGTDDQWAQLVQRFEKVQYKTLDHNSKVIGITLDGKEWHKPNEWAANHRAAIIAHVRDGLQRLVKLSPQEYERIIVDEMSEAFPVVPVGRRGSDSDPTILLTRYKQCLREKMSQLIQVLRKVGWYIEEHQKDLTLVRTQVKTLETYFTSKTKGKAEVQELCSRMKSRPKSVVVSESLMKELAEIQLILKSLEEHLTLDDSDRRVQDLEGCKSIAIDARAHRPSPSKKG